MPRRSRFFRNRSDSSHLCEAPVWFNGPDIFKIDPTTEKSSVRSIPSNTDAAQTMIGFKGGNKIRDIVKSQTV